MGKNKGGRPKKEIDWTEFDKLCAMQCTLEEISAWFECSEDTIERAVKIGKNKGFAEYFSEKKALGRMSLRRSQLKKAMEGNPTMLIWLGKQLLGQKDQQALEHTGPNGGPINIKVVYADERDRPKS